MMVDETRMADSFRDYIRPLIKGEVEIKYQDGVALLTNLKKIKA